MEPNSTANWILWGVNVAFGLTGIAAMTFMLVSTWRQNRATRKDQAEWKAQHDRIEEAIRSSLHRLAEETPRQPRADA